MGNFSKVMKTKNDDKAVCGVLGGLAQYFGFENFLVRLIFFIVALFSGAWILFAIVYLAMAFIMDEYNPDFDKNISGGTGEKDI